MSALWIASYLLIVIFGASITIVSYLRLELWLQSRQFRSRSSRYQQKRLLIDSVPGSVITAEASVETGSSSDKPLKEAMGGHVQSKKVTGPQPSVASVKGISIPDKKISRSKAEPETKIANAGRMNGSRIGPPSSAGTNANSAAKVQPPEAKVAGPTSSSMKDPASMAAQPSLVTPGSTLDELYDREVATVIGSELVDDNEGQQDLSPDEIIEAGVL